MKRKLSIPIILSAIALAMAGVIHAQDVTQPGDPIIASSANSPGSEGVANAIDGQPTKYLNRDSGTAGGTSGFVVSPSVGATRVTGLAMQSANDAIERDPKVVTLEGSNDETITDYNSGNWELITTISDITAWPDMFPGNDRFQTQTFTFENFKAYKHYRWTIVETQTDGNGCCMQIAEVEFLGNVLPGDVTQPGDPIIPSSANSPGSEGVANAIDGQPTKYLNRDSGVAGQTSGFVVSPSIGATVVSGIAMQSANDAIERDPKIITLEGSNDDAVTDFGSGNWELITMISDIPAWPDLFPGNDRFQTQTFLFDNFVPYKHYRWTIVETQTDGNGCCMQIAEVELLGGGAPQDITQPGDSIIASSPNSPGSEGVANAIDGQPTKYLNRDSGVAGQTSGFVVTPSIGATVVTGLAMQSANDAIERDPRIITLEGSNDDAVVDFASGNWELIQRIEDIPDWPGLFPDGDRFQTQTFYFANSNSYKHYRWTIVETQTDGNGCCMQIAEVEFLAVTLGADCNKARFLTQPVTTPVLSGSTATFFTEVNGPWPVQWMKNGEKIAGATSLSHTTDAVSAANAGDVYTVEIVGCEVSAEVTADIFTPSATTSVGFSFHGGGANGTPTDMNEDDIAGIHPQAYWNNLAGGSGISDIIFDSDQNESFMFLEWQASGEWGAGTGSASATQRMLNGLIQNNPGEPGTLTFGNVPDGNHSIIIYTVGIPLQFQDVDYTVNGQTVYTRAINADEYNAAPGFFRGTSADANARTLASYVRFDNVSPSAGNILIEFDTQTEGFDRGGPINAIQILLDSEATGTPPAITADPQPTVGAEDGTVTVSVTASGDNLTYQWRKDGRNLPNGGNVGGATTANLTISSLSEEDVAIYNVAVFNASGSVISKNVSVRVANFQIDEALVGYWKFDESSGSSASNDAPGGSNGAITGSASWGAGKIGNALGFDGASTYVFVENYDKAKSQLAASAWVNVGTGVFEGVEFLRNAIGNLGIGIGSTGNSPAGQFEFGLIEDLDAGGMKLTAAIGAGPNFIRATQSDLFTLGSWQHVAFSADGAQMRLYINGAEVASTDYITDINPPDIDWLSIGARLNLDDFDPSLPLGPDFTLPNYMAGQIDDLALWTRGLSAGEVAKIFAAGEAGNAVLTVTPDAPADAPVLVVGEAEHYDVLTPQGVHTWELSSAQAGFSGDGYMDSVPNAGDNIGNDTDVVTTTSPRLDYDVDFASTGTHYVWILGYAISGSDDSVHVGINGDFLETGTRVDNDFIDGEWTWVGGLEAGGRATIEVASAGTHTVNVWMREDGFQFDKLIVTASESYTPTGQGPAENRPFEPRVPFDGITADKAAGPALAVPGTGLNGEYWQRPVVSILVDGNDVRENGIDRQIEGFGSATGTFTATEFNYLGNDLTPMPDWLAGDAGSYSGPAGNLDDGAFRFTGFINIAAAGSINIGTTSDDGSRINIAGTDVIDNDGGHGDATVDADVAFEAAGVYPIEVTYFNGDWTSDGTNTGNPDPGVHGGANFHLRINGSDVSPAELDLFFTSADGAPPAGGSVTLEVRVASGTDDSEEHLAEGNTIDLTSSDLELGAEGGGADAQLQGIRFLGIDIPAGSTITSANIQFTVDEADDEPTSVQIFGELSPDPGTFTEDVGDISGRARTTAVVAWNDIPNWDDASVGSAGPDQLTPDLSSIVQELIGQAGWSAGNAIAFIIEGGPDSERTAESFDGDAGAAALLHIEYTSGGGGGGAIAWETPNPNTTAADIIGGEVSFAPFEYDGGNAEGTFFTGDGGTTGNPELDAVYNSHGWNGAGASITLSGLTAGESYQVQLLGAGDTRGCCDTRNQAGDDGQGNVSGDFERGNTSVIGSFTAAGATQDIMIVSGTDNGVDPGLSGFIVTDANGAVISAFNVGRTEGDDITVAGGGGGGALQALFVVGTDSVPDLNDSDAGVKALLESLGFAVTMANAPESTTEDAAGMDLIVTSATVNSGDVGDKFQATAIPVVNWEQALQDNYLMTGNDGSDHSTIDGQMTVEIVNSTHALSSGLLPGVSTVATSELPWSWGLPTSGAVTIAHVAGDPAQVVVYGYEAGAAMFDGAVAPARRVMLYGGNDAFAAATAEGVALYDAAIRWAAGLDAAPVGPALSIGLNFGSDEPNGGNLFGLTEDESAGAPAVVQSNWNNLSGASGSGTDLIANAGGAQIPTGITVDWASNGSWASTGRSENNGTDFKPGTADFKLMGGYLDTGDPTTTLVTVSDVPAAVAAAGYDVYVYANGGVAAGRAGAYRVLDAGTGEAITDYVLATSATSPTDYSQVASDSGAGVYGEGTHIVFGGITATSIIIEATTDNGLGAGAPARAPINALQLVAPSAAGGGGGINTDGLVAYWGFDGDLTDSVGSYDGTAQGPVGFEAGQAGFGQAISLDGTGFVEILDSSELDFAGGSMSISGWFTVGSFDKSWQALIAKGEQSAYRVARRGGGAAVAYAGGVGEGADDAPAVDDGGWHHFVAVSDASAADFGTAIYIDGALYGVQATAPALEAESTNLYIGENPEALNRQWIGLIDDIGLWDRVLSAGEVSALYNGGAGVALSTAVGGGGGGITISRSATGVSITFEGTLQSSDSVTGPYSDVAGATSPADIPLSGAAQFFRSSQ